MKWLKYDLVINRVLKECEDDRFNLVGRICTFKVSVLIKGVDVKN